MILAALYESWSLPLAVILVVPMCLLSSVTGVAMARIGINIFVQIGFVVLVGFVDDKWGLSAISKLAGQVAAAGILVWSGQALPWLPTGIHTGGCGC